jgi:hypothetical protein
MRVYVPKMRGRAALDELANIDWSKLATNRGLPGRVQKVRIAGTGQIVSKTAETETHLRALADVDPEESLNAAGELMRLVYNQGSTWPSTHAVVPFWAAFIADPTFPNRERIASDLVLVYAAWVECDHQPGIDVYRASREHLEAAAEHGPVLLARALRDVTSHAAGEASPPDGGFEAMSRALFDAACSQRA